MEMRTEKLFTLSQTNLAHYLWKGILREGDSVIDATCGRGHDSLFIASLLSQWKVGRLHCIDIQKEAIESTKRRLKDSLGGNFIERISFQQTCHSLFSIEFIPKLIIYNLGYLPKGDKSIATLSEKTLMSIKNALKIIPSQGVISIMCYNGHKEGKEEQRVLESFFASLPKNEFSSQRIDKVNAESPPILFLITKR
jgi:hypothetical protein